PSTLMIPKLERSLSLVLHHYSPLAGRLTWNPQDPKPCILVHPGDSVSLTVAETDQDFSRVSGQELRPATELRSFVPGLEATGDSASVLSLQVTFFPNQGFCIGITSHHAVIDGKTSAMFIKSWAYICRLQEHEAMDLPLLPEDLTPRFDRTVIDVLTRLEAKIMELSSRSLKPRPGSEIAADIVRVTLELTRENVERLKERAKNESTRPPFELHLSTFVIAFAYAWTCVVKACRVRRPDFRHRLGPLVPETYFGNCLFPIALFGYEAKEFSEEDGFAKAVEILGDSGVKKMKPGEQIGAVTGSPRLGIYGVDFGWGRPVKTEVVAIEHTKGFFSLLERKDELDGVEMGLCLKESEMNIFLSLFKNGI
ncbi:hypothetical protein EUTSA_v10028123mg, partial [Eutrema salsugineum]